MDPLGFRGFVVVWRHKMGIMIVIILYYPLLCYFGISKGIRYHIKEVGVIWRLYPEKYIMPSRVMRKQFKLEKKEILKFYYYQLYVLNGCLFTLIAYMLIFVLSGFDIDLMFDLIFLFNCVMLLDIFILEIKTLIYKKMKRNNARY